MPKNYINITNIVIFWFCLALYVRCISITTSHTNSCISVRMKKHVLDRNSRVRNYIRYLMTNSSYIITISDTKYMLNTFILFFSEQWYPVEYQHYDCNTHGHNIINIIAHHSDKEDRTFLLVLHTRPHVSGN